MKRSPWELSKCAPSPRAPSVIKMPVSTRQVGWYWTISMSISGAPMRYASAIPSPVTIRPLVVGLYAWPAPPQARITFLAVNASMRPLRTSRATAPQQLPSASCSSEVVNHSS